MRRKRHLYDTAKLNSSKESNMTERQKSFNSADSASFSKDEHGGSKHGISPLQMPMIPTFVADLTPTPTRFLRSCDEVGLFNEISKSSYNEDFKREHSSDESHSVLLSLPSHSQAPIPSVILESIADDNEAEDDDDSAAALQDQSASNFAVSMIDANSQPQLIYSAPQESTVDIKPAEVMILEPPAERPHIQVLLQLPEGGFIPINIPADALAHATFPGSSVISVASPVTQVITPLVVAPGIASTASSTSGITSTTKQKLKAALQQNIQQQQQLTHHQQLLQPIAISPAAASVGRVALPDVSSSSHGSGPSISKTPKLSVNTTVAPLEIARSLSQPLDSQSSDDDEGDGKRKKFLESNRAAANRCRQKKKQWINGLEEKTKRLLDVNRSLTNEMSQLRREIVDLRQMLSHHKDCPPPVTIISSNVRTDSNF